MKPLFGSTLLSGFLAMSMPLAAQTTHYLDCGSSSQKFDSLSPDTAWNVVAQANAIEFHPGDSLLLKRGTSCRGMLAPKGSGAEGRPITIGAYGTGALPVVIGTGDDAGVKLQDQQYWHIEDLEIVGGNPYGILITGSAANLTHFRITDVVVHDVTGNPKSKDTGLIIITPQPNSSTLFHDIVIDGATVYRTTQWAGILVSAGNYNKGAGAARGSDATIRNAVVHDVGGDGILLMLVKNGRLERNVAWDTGMQYTESIGTPDGIWEWMCEDCLVQYNEGFFTDSPGVDGGVFDIDFGNINNTVQYNFGHDSQGYCVSVFGADGAPGFSRNSVVRGNLCLANGRSPREAQRQGAIYLSTWNGGKLSGVQVYGNTVFWDPPSNTAAIVSDAEVDPAAPRIIENNFVLSRAASLVRSTGGLQFETNHYWIQTSVPPSWSFDGKDYGSLSEAQQGGQEKGSRIADPKVNAFLQPAEQKTCTQGRQIAQDIYGRAMNVCAGAVAAHDPADEFRKHALAPLPFRLDGNAYKPRGWTLLALLSPEGKRDSTLARSQMVVLTSMEKQFGPLGLQVAIAPNESLSKDAARNWKTDWNFGSILLLQNPLGERAGPALGIGESAGIVLVDPSGQVVGLWDGLTAAPALELKLRTLLGAPVGTQSLLIPGASKPGQ